MHEPVHGIRFWIGNGLLILALAVLFFLGTLWQHLGVGAMLLWMGLAGTGMYFVMTDKGSSSPFD